MKTPEELTALKEEVKTMNEKLAALTEEELAQVAGGLIPPYPPISIYRNEEDIGYHISPEKNSEPGHASVN